MYTHHSITLQVAEDRRRDMLAAAERARLARQARTVARTRQPRSSSRGGWQLVWQPRPQAQS